jgi:23S rRNA pseudouridine1911/1915/1917 synthase
LHEDERLLVVNKPAGLLTHPAGTNFVWSLIGLLKARAPGEHVNLVHRIDRDTSGVLLVAKDLEADRFLKEKFFTGEVNKAYDALVRSPVAWDEKVVDAPIGAKGEVVRICRAVRDDGLEAKTSFSVLGRNETLTHLRCQIHTGRTHQIRVHLEHLGLPIVGDRLYGVPAEVFLRAYDHGVDAFVMEQAGAPRQALHARRLRVEHPDGGLLDVEAPMPSDMSGWWSDPSLLPFGAAGPPTL